MNTLVTCDRIDAHHHLWSYSAEQYSWMTDTMEVLRRDYLPGDLHSILSKSGIDGSIAVQAQQTIAETEWLLDLSQRHTWIQGVVGWVPLIDEAVDVQLEQFATHPKLKAIRHVLQDEPDDFYILREDFHRGVAKLKKYQLRYDILVLEHHLPQTIQFVDRHPNQIFIVDHMAKPRIREKLLAPWRENLTELAKRENVYCKLSGMVTEADWQQWTDADLAPYLDVTLQAFGPSRLMFGSDWPVLNLAASYEKWLHTVQHFIGKLSTTEQEQIMGGTAKRAYLL